MARGTATDELTQGRNALERGKVKAAIRHGWAAAQAGAGGGDNTLLTDVQRLAVAITEHATGDRDVKEAHMLARYCEELMAQADAGVKPAGLLGGLFQRPRARTKRCPDCAEDIKADARVCRFCGYRYPDADG